MRRPHNMLTHARVLVGVLAGLAALAGCGGGGVGAGDVLVVAAIEITPPGLSLVAGDTRQLQATPRTSSGIAVPNRPVAWSSDDLGVATVSSAGLVTAAAAGSTRISASVDGVRGSIAVTITPKPVVSVSLVPDQVTILVGESRGFAVIARDADGQPVPGRPATLVSDNPLIATIAQSGEVTGVSPGLTVVRATVDGRTGTANVAVNARPATQLDFETQPGTGSAGVPLPAVRIAVRNDQGGTVTVGGLPVTLALEANPTGAVLGGTRTVNAVNGVAIFTDLTVNQAGVGYTLRASSGTLSPAVSAPFAVVAGAATALGVTTQPSAAAASGIPLPRQPVVQVRDAGGNAVAQAGVQVTAALQGAGATLGGTRTVTTNAQGVATFTNLSLTGAAGAYTLLFAAPGLTAVASAAITLGAGSAASLVLARQPGSTAMAGVVILPQPIVQVQDADGNPVAQAGLVVTAAINSGGGALGGTATATTDATGRAPFGNLSIGGTAGIRTLRFSAPSVTPVVSGEILVGSGPPAALALTTQPPTAGTSGAVLSPAPAVQVTDGFGNPVDPDPEVTVTVTLSSGSGTLSGTTTATTAAGAASFGGLILSGPAGSYSLRFDAGGLSAVVSRTITLGAGAATSLSILTQPSATATSGIPFAQQPVIQLRDGAGNAVPQGGVTVTAALETGGGTLGGTLTRTTNASGQAAFTDLVISGAPGPRVLRFTAGTLTGASSATITLAAAPAAALTIVTQPPAVAVSGVALSPQPAVAVTDGGGGPVIGATVTATIGTGPAGSSLSGASAVTDANGVATFAGLTITGGPGDYTLQFESGAATATSSTVTINPPAEKLLLTTAPSSNATNGVPFGTQPAVQVADAAGAAVAMAGATVTAVIASGPTGATLTSATATTDGNGLATFAGLAINGLVGSYTLRFESGALTPVTTGNISLAAGAPATLTIPTQPPTTAVNDQPFSNNTVVRVQDASGNNVPNVQVTAAVATGSGTLKGTLTRTTSSNGRATFNDLELVGLAGPYTLVFSVVAGPTVTSRTITLAPGNDVALAIQVEPSSSARSGVNFAVQPKVELRDSGGNLVTDDGVSVSAVLETVSGVGTLGGTTTVSSNNGVASFTNLRITGTGTFRIRFTASGHSSVTSGTIEVSL